MPLARHLRSFSLGTLMVLVTVACLIAAWLAHERRVVQGRQALIGHWNSDARYSKVHFAADIVIGNPAPKPDAREVSWSRRLFGDRSIRSIRFRGSDRAIAIEQAKRWFPEAAVIDDGEWFAGPYSALPPPAPSP